MLNKYFKKLAKKIIGETSTEKLIGQGMKVGKNFSRQQGCFIDNSHAWLIEIGDNVTFSIRVTVLAHDASTKLYLGYAKIGKVKIGNNVFVGANSTILCNVEIGDNCIIGANSVVTKDVPSNSVVAGNPAKVICTVTDYLDKNKELMLHRPRYGDEYTVRKSIDNQKKEQMVKELNDGIGYVE